MKVKQYSRVLLADGRTTYIVEIFEEGKVFLADVDLEDGEESIEEICIDDIKKVLKY